MRKILLIALLALNLQGCIFAAGAAAGAAAIAIVNDKRSVESVLQDKNIANAATDNIKADTTLRDAHINVTSFNRVVLMTGEVSTADLRQRAETIVQSIPNVGHIYNEIQVRGSASTLSVANDVWITTKIKTMMLANRDLRSSSIKVITESSTVYLMGIVSHEQANIASDIARQVTGVEKVI
ncbi:hypothetical protein AYO45_06945, partial [Gammaproteobacteria bacterium SCGC AG-212-F23]